MKKSQNVTVARDDVQERLDRFLTRKFPNYSRSYFQHLIQKGHVAVNGKAEKKHYLIETGNQIAIDFIEIPGLSLSAQDIPLDILFEDEHILVINKPAHMVVHPAPGNRDGTVANALLFRCQHLLEEAADSLRPGIVHRLDKETSGVLILAKTHQAHAKLVEQFAKRLVKKTYLAICRGNPGSRLINEPISRHPRKRKIMTVATEGKEAITHCRVIAFFNHHAYVTLKPETGRTHQLRVHLKHLNCPILGDETYGVKDSLAERQMLHAWKLQLNHPITGELLSFEAPLPQDFQQTLEKLKLV